MLSQKLFFRYYPNIQHIITIQTTKENKLFKKCLRCQQQVSFSLERSSKPLTPRLFEVVKSTNTGQVPSSNLWKAFVFTITFSAGSFLGASVLEYENIRSKVNRTTREYSLNSWFRNKKNKPKNSLVDDVIKWWSKLSQGEKVFIPICVLNIIVFGMWRVPKLQPLMVKYFCSNPASSNFCWPMILSTFSHYSMFHIFANMYVLHSFSEAAVSTLGKEQFLGLYLSAGAVSTFASYLFKTVTNQAGLSLGASGAIMAILAVVCSKYPDTQLSVIFLPMLTFSAGNAIKFLMGLDFAGCVLGWKLFDHAAHLGGALCGLFWCYYGCETLWPKRIHFLKYWHEFRKT